MGAPVGWGPAQPSRVARLGAQHPPGPRRMLPAGSCSCLSAATVERSHFELAAAVRRKGYGPNPSFRCLPAGLLGINKSKARGIWDGIGEATHWRGTANRGSTAGGHRGPARTYVLIPHQGGAEILLGTRVPWGPLARCIPARSGRWEGGSPRCPVPPALPRCRQAHANLLQLPA